MGMFDFFSMYDNYEERKVDRFEEKGCIIDTCAVTDSDKPFETGILHPKYNNGKWIIVELYDTEEKAKTGHNKWIKTMTSKSLPDFLICKSTAEIANTIDSLGGERQRLYKRSK